MRLHVREASRLAVLAATLWASTAAASYRTVADDALARSSAAAVRGRVVAVTPGWDAAADAIYTYVTLDVSRSWGLDGNPAQVVVKLLGGIVGDTALRIGGQAHFDLGEDVLVFLDVRPRDHTLSVAGLEQGKWMVSGFQEPSAAFVRDSRGTDPSVVVARDYRASVDLEALAGLVGTRASAAGAVLHPDAGASSSGADSGHGVAAFTLLNPSLPARWHQADTGTPVYVDSQTGGHPQFAGGGLTQLARAAAAWTGAGSLNLQPGVQRSPRCFSNSESDSRLSVTYGDPCGEIADASNTLAIGGAYFTSDVRTINGVNYWRIIKGMVVTDNVPSKYSWMSTGCYEDMLTHEIGHAIGFGHTSASPAVMYPSISGTCGSRTIGLPLQADDRAGVAAVYPGAVTGLTPPGPPTGLAASVAGAIVTLTWTPPSAGSAPSGYRLQAGSVPGASNYGTLTAASGPLVIPNVPNGIYYVRLVAVNGAGASAPTADLMVAVGPALPGMPRSVSATAGAGGSVLITWLPPSSGGAPTSYVVVAGVAPGATTYQLPVAGTTFSAAGVPAGVYYVRVVARNSAGIGPLTPEVALTVPH